MTNPASGPKTQAGKEVARWNATRHGIRSPAPVVPGLENTEDWEEHLEGVLESLSPEGHFELVLAERVALLSWRLHRVTRYERESIALSQEKAEEDLAKRRWHQTAEEDLADVLTRPLSKVSGPIRPEDVRSSVRSTQADHRLLRRLPKLPDDKPLSGRDAESILWSVTEQVDAVAEGEVAPEDLLEKVHVPGVPEDVDWKDYEGWTAGLVKAGIEAIARATGEDAKELLEYAEDAARRSVIDAKQAAEQVERDLRDMSRERLLPDEMTLQKIARYEAHLSRQLFQTKHELEALQTKRGGGAAPLARLDVQGLEG